MVSGSANDERKTFSLPASVAAMLMSVLAVFFALLGVGTLLVGQWVGVLFFVGAAGVTGLATHGLYRLMVATAESYESFEVLDDHEARQWLHDHAPTEVFSEYFELPDEV